MALLDLGNGVTVDVDKQLLELDRAELEDSLYLFLRSGWRNIDPASWVDGWAGEAVAEHLQAVVDGEIRRLLINIPPRCLKPVRDDALVPVRDRGLVPLSEVRIRDFVLTHRGRFRQVLSISRQASLPILKLTTRRGRVVHAAPDHPFLTPQGWRPLERLGPQEVVGLVPMHATDCGTQTISDEAARLLGYLVGDGSCRGSPNVTVADDTEAADIRRVIEALGFTYADQAYHMANTGYLLRRIVVKAAADHIHRPRLGYRGPVRQFMELHGLRDRCSYTKDIPEAVLRGNASVVRNFIGAYWACDGTIGYKGAKRDGTNRDDLFIGCDSVNHAFLLQLQTLLLRVGIDSIIRKKITKIKTKKQGDQYVSYSLSLSDQDNCWRFAETIPIHHAKMAKLLKARRRRFDFDRDLIGDVIETLEPDAPASCSCLEVDEDHSFVANGFAVHNSSLCSVALPAWAWAQRRQTTTSGPGVRFLYASYRDQLSLRDSVKCRRLIESPWFRKHWGERFVLMPDQNAKHRFGNDRGGERLITSIGAGVTGEGGDIIVCDDPNAANEVLSDAAIQSTIDWWDQTMSTRLNDPKTGAYIVIQQRLAENDLTGHILENSNGEWTHLCLPMAYEPERSFVTVIGWEDPRTKAGELLWPERFGPEEVRALESALGPWGTAGQLQQRPEPKGGGVIKREWWLTWEEAAFPPMDFILASLDTAYTEKTENDYSALTIWGVFTSDTVAQNRRTLDANGRPVYAERSFMDPAPKVMLMTAWQERLPLHELVKKVAETCKKLKCDKLIIESKAAGHSVAQEMRRLYGHEDFGVQLIDPRAMDKLARLYSVQHLFAEGMIYAPDRAWADMVITQVGTFPHGRHDDLVDTVSQALRHMRDLGLLIRAPERLADIEEAKRYAKAPEPLYPG